VAQLQVDADPVIGMRRRRERVFDQGIAGAGAEFGFGVEQDLVHVAVLIKLQQEPEAAHVVASGWFALADFRKMFLHELVSSFFVVGFAFAGA